MQESPPAIPPRDYSPKEELKVKQSTDTHQESNVNEKLHITTYSFKW